MALIHIKKEKGKWVAYGYGNSYRHDSPIGAYTGLKVFRAYMAGLVCSKYPLQRTDWLTTRVSQIAQKRSRINQIMNERFSIKTKQFLNRE